MSVAVFIVPERESSGCDAAVDGKALGHAEQGTLETICQQLGVSPITQFLSQDPEELADCLGDEATEAVDFPAEEWFSAADGLATVRALIKYLQAEPSALKHSEDVVEDLKAFEIVLADLESEGIRWHLQMDF